MAQTPFYLKSGWYCLTTWALCVVMTSPNGNIFRVTVHLCGEFTGHRWIPRTKASNAEHWCFLWSAPELWRHCDVFRLCVVLQEYKSTGRIARQALGGRPSKYSQAVENFVFDAMEGDDELTLRKLQRMILEQLGLSVSVSAIHRVRQKLQYTFKQPGYCQMVRAVNQEKRLQFARDHPDFHVTATDCIFSDETSVELDWHRRRCARRKGQPAKPKPKPKHPVKVTHTHIYIHIYIYIYAVVY